MTPEELAKLEVLLEMYEQHLEKMRPGLQFYTDQDTVIMNKMIDIVMEYAP